MDRPTCPRCAIPLHPLSVVSSPAGSSTLWQCPHCAQCRTTDTPAAPVDATTVGSPVPPPAAPAP